jgi:hypothetical protein
MAMAHAKAASETCVILMENLPISYLVRLAEPLFAAA